MKDDFINIGKDPTSSLPSGISSLEAQYNNLTPEEKLMVYHKLVLGANHMICDIDTFIKDDYYLGLITQGGTGIYDYWKDTMKKMYPSPVINKYPYVSLGGAIFTLLVALKYIINCWKDINQISSVIVHSTTKDYTQDNIV